MARTSPITLVAAGDLALGALTLLAWRITGNPAWVSAFFPTTSAVLIVGFAVIGLWLGLQVTAHFGSTDLLRQGWTLIALSNLLLGTNVVLLQLLRGKSPLFPFLLTTTGGEVYLSVARQNGLTFGGPLRLLLIAAGLYFVLKAYRQSGLLGKLKIVDWALIALFGVYTCRNLVSIAATVQRQGGGLAVWQVFGWPVDLVLWLLLIQALLLFRSARQMDPGRIGKCWKALSFGVFLTVASDIGIWAITYGYLPGYWAVLIYYPWIAAAAAFARAPALQLEAIRAAESGGSGEEGILREPES